MCAECDSMNFWRIWKGNRACGARMNVTPGACEAHFLAKFRAESPPILQLGGITAYSATRWRRTS